MIWPAIIVEASLVLAVSGISSSLRYHQSNLATLPWAMSSCTERVFAVSATACALACLAADTNCAGSNYDSSGGSSAAACVLCSDGDIVGPVSGSAHLHTASFLWPYEHSSAPLSTVLVAPRQNSTSATLILVSGIPADIFSLFLTEPSCPVDASSKCLVDLFIAVSVENPSQIVADKSREGDWIGPGEIRTHDGVFQAGRRFHLLILVLSQEYVLIADGVEIMRYPVATAITPTIKLFTKGLDPQHTLILMR